MDAIGMRAIAAAIAVLVGAGAGIGIGIATGKAVEGISRNPESSGKITTALIIGAGFAEATAIYGLLISIILIFVGIK
ncbi:ATP synthase F0 subunit C [Clostridium gasigenes]|uniref:ATP synthase subunit c n=1 Tax=Clostridium gasigenes TaxID=94869 RepID=A0A1H0RUJ6_9CLOT|nr:ATP synthase F0 subunit C [Clostridium gasigenes]MBB6622608.1 ATP synthase F0 subunit C [Clostridium gasigenes]MBB6714207.1 ATP synthase F0 subunit C [Clostridium gasigenes]MBU3088540.1 ATP synthase F0 subunit C [Clostridium gasigenes]MBU3103864.1 ATP synthase F0 subunit C [Clostridium gasigenes]MBU3132795.1 ATP synthase F0 subunit C [Clostridium gasigenes]